MSFSQNGTFGFVGASGGGGGGGAFTPVSIVSLTDAAPVLTNAALGFAGSCVYEVSLSASRTMAAPTGGVNGQIIIYRIIQGVGGSKLLTWDPIFAFTLTYPVPSLSFNAGAIDQVRFIFNGTNWICDGYSLGQGQAA